MLKLPNGKKIIIIKKINKRFRTYKIKKQNKKIYINLLTK